MKAQARKDGKECWYYISEFFMVSYPCNRSQQDINYYQYKCVIEKCENCPDYQTWELPFLRWKNDHEKQAKVGQSETLTTM